MSFLIIKITHTLRLKRKGAKYGIHTNYYPGTV